MSNELKLMVGDWVTSPYAHINPDLKFIKIDKLMMVQILRIELNGSVCDYRPIKLTPEIMDMIDGIYKNENRGTRYGFLNGYYNIDKDTDVVAIFEGNDLLHIYTYEYSHEQFQLICSLEYLHQLQQLIRLFCNKEIEVKWEK